LSEDLFGHPILLHSLQLIQSNYLLPLYPFYYIFSFIQSVSNHKLQIFFCGAATQRGSWPPHC
jgi:hypothetical protein